MQTATRLVPVVGRHLMLCCPVISCHLHERDRTRLHSAALNLPEHDLSQPRTCRRLALCGEPEGCFHSVPSRTLSAHLDVCHVFGVHADEVVEAGQVLRRQRPRSGRQKHLPLLCCPPHPRVCNRMVRQMGSGAESDALQESKARFPCHRGWQWLWFRGRVCGSKALPTN